MNEIKCLRCGRCCHYLKNGILKKCKFLVVLPDFKTVCRVFNSRLGRVIDVNEKGERIICILREHDSRIIEGCPYNSIIKSIWVRPN